MVMIGTDRSSRMSGGGPILPEHPEELGRLNRNAGSWTWGISRPNVAESVCRTPVFYERMENKKESWHFLTGVAVNLPPYGFAG
jgi:hypothetical protein